MTAPQLPLYSLIRDDIAGVYYAQLKHDDQKIIGVGNKNPQLVAAKHRQMKTTEPDNSWAEKRAEWRDELMNLAVQIGAVNSIAKTSASGRKATPYSHPVCPPK